MTKRLVLATLATLIVAPALAADVEQAKAAADERAVLCTEKIAEDQEVYGESGFCPPRLLEEVTLRDRSGTYIEPNTSNTMKLALVENGIYLLDEKFFGTAWKSVMVPWQTTATPEIQGIDPDAIGVYVIVEIMNADAISFWVIRRDGSFYNLTEAVEMKPAS